MQNTSAFNSNLTSVFSTRQHSTLKDKQTHISTLPYCTETPKHYNRYYDALQQPLFGALLQLKVTPVAFTEAQLGTK